MVNNKQTTFWIVLGIGLLTVVSNARSVYLGAASQAWPSVRGTVLSAAVLQRDDPESTDYIPEIRYRYRINAVAHTGSRINFGKSIMATKKNSEKIIQTYPPGSTVAVYYDPVRPHESTLEPGCPMGGLVRMGIGFLLIVFAIGIQKAGPLATDEKGRGQSE